MAGIIGVDPHRASHTSVAINGNEDEIVRKKVRAGVTQVHQLSVCSWMGMTTSSPGGVPGEGYEPGARG